MCIHTYIYIYIYRVCVCDWGSGGSVQLGTVLPRSKMGSHIVLAHVTVCLPNQQRLEVHGSGASAQVGASTHARMHLIMTHLGPKVPV